MFHGWDNYFFMLGSGAASLIGLLFIVVTLTQGFERSQALRGASIYMTPSAVHFAVVLSISAVAIAPDLGTSMTATIFGVGALVGLANAIWTCVGIRTLRSSGNPPHWTDFWWYGAAPAVVYVGLVGASAALGAGAGWAVKATAALLLILLLVGIRNAWDLVTWMAPGGISPPPGPGAGQPPGPGPGPLS